MSATLEQVERCGLCGEALRVMHPRLKGDDTHEWSMMACANCETGWLNPRYTPEAIGAAYGQDYPPYHRGQLRPAPTTRVQRLRRAVADGELGALGYPMPRPAWTSVGRAVMRQTVREADRLVRHAPAQPGGRLLDVGCSNGAYVALMSDLGWDAHGVELDPVAVSNAQKAGLAVREGTMSDLSVERDGLFDYITLGHVIEHVHDPIGDLRCVREIVKPGGVIWVATPNLGSFNHRLFGPGWRALDPPRHLVLFTADSLAHTLGKVGFVDVRRKRPTASADWNVRESLRVLGIRGHRKLGRLGAITNVLSYRWWNLADEMVFTARAPQ